MPNSFMCVMNRQQFDNTHPKTTTPMKDKLERARVSMGADYGTDQRKWGDWSVDADGTLTSAGGYTIEADRLTEPDWLLHMSKKPWCNLSDFTRAYMKALTLAGKKEVTIKISYP